MWQLQTPHHICNPKHLSRAPFAEMLLNPSRSKLYRQQEYLFVDTRAYDEVSPLLSLSLTDSQTLSLSLYLSDSLSLSLSQTLFLSFSFGLSHPSASFPSLSSFPRSPCFAPGAVPSIRYWLRNLTGQRTIADNNNLYHTWRVVNFEAIPNNHECPSDHGSPWLQSQPWHESSSLKRRHTGTICFWQRFHPRAYDICLPSSTSTSMTPPAAVMLLLYSSSCLCNQQRARARGG